MTTRQEDMWKELQEAQTHLHNASFQYNQAREKEYKISSLIGAAQRRTKSKEALWREARIIYEGLFAIYQQEFSTEIADNNSFMATMQTFKEMMMTALRDKEKMPK